MSPTWSLPEGERPTRRYAWGGFTVATNLALPRLWPTGADRDIRFRWRSDPVPPAGGALRRDDLRTRGGDRLRVAVLPGGIVRYQIDAVGTYQVRSRDRGIDFYPGRETDPMRVEHFLLTAVLPIYAGLLDLVGVLGLGDAGHLYQLARARDLGPVEGLRYLLSRLDPRRFTGAETGSRWGDGRAWLRKHLAQAARTPWARGFRRR